MLWLRKPSADSIRQLLAAEGSRELTYRAVGATAAELPAGYVVDHTRVKLGEGEQVYSRAVAALRRWEQFQLGWLEPVSTNVPLATGQTVAVVARVAGFWWLNACRVVYVVDDAGQASRFGFAYGTLPAHAGSGEERFLVEWDRSDDSVWYDILAFSRPRHWLAWIGYPLVRSVQRRFGRDSATVMLRAVSAVGH